VSESPAPFIPTTPEDQPIPDAPWRVFGSGDYFKLWLAQCVSSLGDWIGIIAILAIAARVSGGSGAAVSLVMVARMAPGFVLAPVGGALIDRWDRRKVMVSCDILRAGLYLCLPIFADSLLALVLFSFAIEVLTLLWGPAKDASTPKLVPADQLASANSLSLFAAYGTMPIGGVIFAALAALAAWMGHFSPLHSLGVDQESLALWCDGLTFLASAALIFRLPLGRNAKSDRRKIDWTETYRDIKEGAKFMASHAEVRAIMVGLGCGLIGGGAMVPLGPVFSKKVLGAGAPGFGVLMTALGVGVAVGVMTLLWIQKRVSRMKVFVYAMFATGGFLVVAVSFSSLYPAAFFIGLVGAGAGSSYVTGFTILQEEVSDELRGRTFAALYTVVRLCLLFSLTVFPLFSDLFDWLVKKVLPDRIVTVGTLSYSLPGVRLALWFGGCVTMAAALLARRDYRRQVRERLVAAIESNTAAAQAAAAETTSETEGTGASAAPVGEDAGMTTTHHGAAPAVNGNGVAGTEPADVNAADTDAADTSFSSAESP
jgi:dTMP kinase